MKKGTVKFYDSIKGWGFITDSEGNDVFVHYSQIQMEGYKRLDPNDIVEFEIGIPEGENARKQAINVCPVLTLAMIVERLKKVNQTVLKVKNGSKSFYRVYEDVVVMSPEEGMNFIELAAYAGFDVKEYER